VPARAVALLLGAHDSSHASTGPLGNTVVSPDLVDPSLSWSTRAALPLVAG